MLVDIRTDTYMLIISGGGGGGGAAMGSIDGYVFTTYVMLPTPQGIHNSHAMYHQTTTNIVNIHVY